jgi:hypothetical protein
VSKRCSRCRRRAYVQLWQVRGTSAGYRLTRSLRCLLHVTLTGSHVVRLDLEPLPMLPCVLEVKG